MSLITTKSDALFNEAKTFMPGGVNSPVRACGSVGRKPLFIDHAHGSRIYDVDSNEYIDYVCSWGPNILGHANENVISAVTKVCKKGLTFGACHEGEIALAEKIKRHFPSMELLRLVNSGTEAAMSAIRAARGYTGRDLVLKFEGCYHGHSGGLLVKAGSGLLTNAAPSSAGVPKKYTDCTVTAKYNDEKSVEDAFEKYGNDIACLIVEPCAANMGVVPPKKGFLKFLRNITAEYNSVLIFDEVITGFRLSIGGAQKLYGVTPDLTALGKIIGGGMPLAAYGGKAEIMEMVSPLGSVYQAGTLSGNPVAVAAGLATVSEIEKDPEFYKKLEEKSARLENTMRSVEINVNRAASIMTPFFTDTEVDNYENALNSDSKKFAGFYTYLLKHGIYSAPSQYEAMFVSAAHSDADIEKTCNVIVNYFHKQQSEIISQKTADRGNHN